MLEDNENLVNEITEDRSNNCNCMTNQKPDVTMCSYDFKNISDEEGQMTCEEKRANRRKMINEIKALNFAVVELALYLDTHETDEKALMLYKEYANKLHDLKDKYQKIYGPLSIYYPCKKWRWLEEPWPWERGNF